MATSTIDLKDGITVEVDPASPSAGMLTSIAVSALGGDK